MSDTKQIHFDVPKKLFEEFVRVFPGSGERTKFFRYMMARAVEGRREKDCFYQSLVDRISNN